jgi:hypothetical protein
VELAISGEEEEAIHSERLSLGVEISRVLARFGELKGE